MRGATRPKGLLKTIVGKPIGSYDLAHRLWDLRELGKRPPARANIVNPKLCGKSSPCRACVTRANNVASIDDIITRLKPTLEELKGCDIIDYNPGVGVWSSRIHEYLKPRRHILLEQHPHLYDPFLKEAGFKSGSTEEWFPLRFRPFDQLVETGYVQPQPVEEGSAPPPYGMNNKLLVLANLATGVRGEARITSSDPELAKRWITEYLEATFTRNNIHKYGLVRLLVWVPELESYPFIPRAAGLRNRQTVLTEAALSECTMEATTLHNFANLHEPRRDYPVTKWSNAQAAARMQENSISTPEGRALPPLKLAPDLLEVQDVPQAVKYTHTQRLWQPWHEEILQLGANPKRIEYVKRSEKTRLKSAELIRMKPDKIAQLKKNDDPAYLQALFSKLRGKLGRNNRQAFITQKTASGFFDVERRLEVEPRSKQLLEEREQILAEIDRLDVKLRAATRTAIEDRRATFERKTEPLGFWDKRPYDPLFIENSEVYITSGMSLLSMTPRLNDDPSSPLHTLTKDQDIMENFVYLTKDLFNFPSSSVRDAIARLPTIGDVDYIMSKLTLLTNPQVGGTKDASDLTVRLMTAEMFAELAILLRKIKWKLPHDSKAYTEI